MGFAFDAGQHFLNVVQAADETGPEIKASGAERLSGVAGPLDASKTRAQRLIDNDFQRLPPPAGQLLETSGDILLQGQRGPHSMMLGS